MIKDNNKIVRNIAIILCGLILMAITIASPRLIVKVSAIRDTNSAALLALNSRGIYWKYVALNAKNALSLALKNDNNNEIKVIKTNF